MPVPDFSPGEVLTAAAMDSIGLWKVADATFTAASSVDVANCYSTNYTNYLIVARLQTSSQDSFYQNLVSGSPAVSNYNRQLVEAQASSVGTNRASNQSSFVFTSNSNGAFFMTAEASIFAPFLAEPTGIQVNHCRTDGAYTVPSAFMIYGNHSTATSYTGFRLSVPSGTMTGRLWVYGRRD
jgi:hypothetical protein